MRNGVTAHQGNSSEYPGNTLAAFKSALDVGADWIELDVRLARDGKLVVIHDEDTNSVGDQNVRIADVTYQQLKEVDVAYQFRESRNLSYGQCPRAMVPLLSEVIALIKSQNRTRMSIQPKAWCVKEAVELVKRMKAEAWIGFNDGDLEKLKRVKELLPSIPVFFDRRQSDIHEDIRIAQSHGFESVVLHYSQVTKDKVDALDRAGLEAGVWTVLGGLSRNLNDAETEKQFLQYGVDRFYTDDPRLLLKIRATQ